MSLYNTWPFGSSFFQSKTVSRTPLHASVCHSFSLLSNSPLDGYTTYPFISWWTFVLLLLLGLWIMLLSTFAPKFLYVPTFSFLLVIYLGVELLGHMIILLFNILRNCQTFPMRFYLFTSHQQCMSAYILVKTCFVFLIMVLGKRKQFPLCSCVFENDYMY